MRCFASSRSRGFTLLELVVALACSALLVTLLVSVWLQMIRSSTQVVGEAAVLREREVERRGLQSMLQGLRWSATSLTPGGALPWEASGSHVALWSGDSLGQTAGPVRWSMEGGQGPLKLRLVDPLAPGAALRPPEWPEVQALRLEILMADLQSQGEAARWVGLSQWDPARPFRPEAFRLWVRWKGQDTEECLVKTL